MAKKTLLLLFLVFLVCLNDIESKKLARSRSSSSSSGRSTSSRRTSYNAQPAPTSFSNPVQASAPKPSLSGWQQKPAQKTNTGSQSHSYPSSNTGLSGNNPPKQPSSHQESIQKSNVSPQQSAVQLPKTSQTGHSYPASNGLSGNSGQGVGYPQGSGLSGSNAAVPPYQGVNTANNYHSPGGGGYPNANLGTAHQHPQGPPPPYSSSGNNYYNHPQGPPPPYTNFGHGNGGYGGQGYGGYSPQSPGYFGNYANSGKGYGGVSRTGSALTGVGIAGAGIGTVLTGLALWNLARSTGRQHHTVIYDNRGQPVAVAPENNTSPVVDPILGDLVNCTLTIANGNSTEIIAIPCSIATSFTPEADVKDVSINNQTNDNTKCTISVVTKTGSEFSTTIPCSVLLSSAAENNVTEPPIVNNIADIGSDPLVPGNNTVVDRPVALEFSNLEDTANPFEGKLNCTNEQGDIRDPINPCFSVKQNLTVIPLQSNQ